LITGLSGEHGEKVPAGSWWIEGKQHRSCLASHHGFQVMSAQVH